MEIYENIIGNICEEPMWSERLHGFNVEYIDLDPWTAQKSRFIGRSNLGNVYAIALKRNKRVRGGDIILYRPKTREAVVLRVLLNSVLVIELNALAAENTERIISAMVELGHALGNQHWPAVVKGLRMYVPLTVDKKVMLSVMETHRFEGIRYRFQPGAEIIPNLAPHEIRQLFGSVEQESHAHNQYAHVWRQ